MLYLLSADWRPMVGRLSSARVLADDRPSVVRSSTDVRPTHGRRSTYMTTLDRQPADVTSYMIRDPYSLIDLLLSFSLPFLDTGNDYHVKRGNWTMLWEAGECRLYDTLSFTKKISVSKLVNAILKIATWTHLKFHPRDFRQQSAECRFSQFREINSKPNFAVP